MGKDHVVKVINREGGMGFIMFVAWFGALVYFMNQATGFLEVLLAFLKALVWPAILLYHVLSVVGA